MRAKKLLIFVVLIMLCVLCLGLVACKPEDADTPPENNETDVSDLIKEMTGKLTDSLDISQPRSLNIDVLGTAALTDNKAATRMWKYELVARGNVGLVADSVETDTNLLFEINGYNADDVKSTIISLLYESEVNDKGEYTGSYLYLILPGETTPIKINAISLLKLIPGLDEAANDIDISQYVEMVIGMLFQTGEKKGNDYVFNMDLIEAWELIGGALESLVGDAAALSDLIGMDATPIFEAVNGIIPMLFEGLTYRGVAEGATEESDIAVTTVSDIFKYLNQTMPGVKAEVKFGFDTAGKFTGANAVAQYEPRNSEGIYTNPTHKFDLNISKLFVGVGNNVAYDENYSLTAAERIAIVATNPLNFKIDGRLLLGGSQELDVKINMDLNPLALIGGTFDISKLSDIGYMSLIIDNVNATASQKAGENVLTLILDNTLKELIVSLKTPGTSGIPVNDNLHFAGVYKYADLSKTLNFINGVSNVSNMSDEAAETDVVGVLLDALMSRLDLSDLKNNGVVLKDPKGLVYTLCNALGLPTTGMLDLGNLIFGHLFNWSESPLNIMVDENGVQYGQAAKVDTALLELNGYADNTYGALLDTRKAVKTDASIQKTYEYGEAFNIALYGKTGSTVMPNSFKLTGTNRAGATNTEFDAVLYGFDGYDPYKVGTQDVTVYYGINSKVSKVLANGLVYGQLSSMVPANTPIFGAHTMTFKVTVHSPVEDGATVLKINGTTTMMAGDDIAAELNATLRYIDTAGNTREVAVTNDMISCKQPVIVGGKFNMMGNYKIVINHKGIKYEQNVTINELTIEGLGTQLVARKSIKEQATFFIRSFDKNGTIVESDVEGLSIAKVTNAATSRLDVSEHVLGDDGRILGNASYATTKYIVTLSYVVGGVTKYIELPVFTGIKLENKYNIVAVQAGSLFPQANYDFSKEYNAATTITVRENDPNDAALTVDTVYNVVFDKATETYIAINNGKKLSVPIDIKFYQTKEWNSATNKQDTLATEKEVALSATKTVLGAGGFRMEGTIGDDEQVVFKRPMGDCAPIIYFDKVRTAEYTSMATLIKAAINAQGLTIPAAAAGATTLGFKWSATDVAWGFYFNKGTNVAPDASELSFTFESEMYKDGKWGVAEYDAKYGTFSKNADKKCCAYKITLTVKMGDYEFNDTFIINAAQAV